MTPYFESLGVAWVAPDTHKRCTCGLAPATKEHKKRCFIFLVKGDQWPEGTASFDTKTSCAYIFLDGQWIQFTGSV